MTQVVTSAAKIVVLKPIADNTVSVGGSAAAICATVVVSSKGLPGRPLYVTGDSVESVLGKPQPMANGTNAEGMRHLNDALSECQYGYVVRTVGADARFPSITLPVSGAPIKSAHAYGTDIDVGSGNWLSIYPKDGSPSTDRRVSITDIDTGNSRFTLLVEEKQDGEWVELEKHEELGAKHEDLSDMGLPAYAPVVLESYSEYVNCEIDSDVDFSALAEVEATLFEGGTNGSDPSIDEIKSAWDVLKHANYDFNLAFAAGQYDPTVLHHINDICEDLMVQFRFDAPPHYTEEQVATWLVDLGMGNSYQARCLHYPYKANDAWYGGKSVWGVSGAAVAAKARGYANTTAHADTPGVHFTDAGSSRGYIDRSGIEPLHTTGFTADEDKVEVKSNKRIVARYSPVYRGREIGDGLTTYAKNNYLRFEWVVAVHNYLMHQVLDGLRSIKFEPDGLTRAGITRIANEECQKLVQSGALVAPRDSDTDGFEPYKVEIEQSEIDLWKVTLHICPTGAFRRGALQGVLVK